MVLLVLLLGYIHAACVTRNGIRQAGEQCDDNNTWTNDGCDNCVITAGWECWGGRTGVSLKDTCNEVCGDGFNMGYYECDDGNTNANDGCGPDCKVEYGYACENGTDTTADACIPVCGDGNVMVNDEECDDKNVALGDGCDNLCKVENGWKCSQHHAAKPSICLEICGDGLAIRKPLLRPQDNLCDDGNTANGDGCSNECWTELGFTCSGGNSTWYDTCNETCGDGRNIHFKACDDGNT